MIEESAKAPVVDQKRLVQRCMAADLERGGDPIHAPECGVRASFVKNYPDEPSFRPIFLCKKHAKQKRWNDPRYPAPVPLNGKINEPSSAI